MTDQTEQERYYNCADPEKLNSQAFAVEIFAKTSMATYKSERDAMFAAAAALREKAAFLDHVKSVGVSPQPDERGLCETLRYRLPDGTGRTPSQPAELRYPAFGGGWMRMCLTCGQEQARPAPCVWQDIRTCPDDGTWFLGYLDGEYSVVRTWKGWAPDDWTPTHWMPLPTPPVVDTAPQGGEQ